MRAILQRLLFASILLVALVSSAHATGAIVQSKTCSTGGGSLPCAFTANTAANDAVIVLVDSAGAATFTAKDSQSNTYALALGLFAYSNEEGAIYYTCSTKAAADTITATTSNTGGTLIVTILEVSGLATSSCYNVGTSATAANTTVFNSGNTATTSQANEYILGWGHTRYDTYTYTAGSGFTMRATPAVGTQTDYVEDENVISVSPYTATATASNSSSSLAWASITTWVYPAGSGQSPAATPTFSPAAGTIGSAQPISISDTTAGATIYYTTNGTTPTVTPSEQYTGSFTLAASATVQAIAVASGFGNSAVGSAAYTVVPTATPTISPAAGTISSTQPISISDTTSGATIYYTTNGTTPTVTPSEQYTGPFTLAAPATVQAIAAASGFSNSAVASAAYTIQVAATPTFNPAAGSIGSAQPISISDTTAGATIYYTTNGTTPTVTPSEQYTGPFTLAASATVQAMAVASGFSNSTVGSAAYTVVPTATPTFSPVAGAISSAQPISISDTSAGATIYYTTNGTTPTVTPSEQYTGPFTLAASATVRAMAVASGFSNSAVASAAYTILTAAATPTFNPVAGTIGSAQPITISDTTAGATIYYTTNGTTPTVTPSEQYTGPFMLSASATVQAMAVASGFSNSAVGSAAYTVVPTATPTFTPLAGTISSTQPISISDTSAGATIYYTTDGSTPTVTPSEQYTGPFTLAASATVQAMAVASGFSNSAIASAAYTVPATATPTFSPSAGTINPAQPISISDTTSGATIYYTTNGTTPTVTPSEQYTGPFTLAASGTVQAMAVASGSSNSAVASAAYTFQTTGGTPGAIVQSKNCNTGGGSLPCAFTTSPAANHAVIVLLDSAGAATFTVKDSQSNTYAAALGPFAYGNEEGAIYYTCSTKAAADTITATTSNTGGTLIVTILEVSGLATSSCFNVGASASAANTVAFNSGNTVATSQANEYILGWGHTRYDTYTYTAGSGFTVRATSTVGVQTDYIEDENVTSTGTYSATATASNSTSSLAWASITTWVYPPGSGQLPAAAPTFSPAGGTIGSAQPISISDTTAGATIYYTTNGTTPTATPSEQYTGPFTLAASATVQAMAVANGFTNSIVASAAYTVVPTATPTISPAAGTITSTQPISISDTTSGATIYYTTNGTTPTVTPSEQYTGPFTLAATATVQAMAVASGFNNSAVASAAYTIQVTATPTFSPAAGSIGSSQPISISDTTAGATIYYTTNGTTPTVTPSEQYTGPFTLAASATVQAMAVASGFTNGIVASAAYTVVPTATPTISPAAGAITSTQLISISDTTAGATIYYTTNGTTPTVTPSEQYTGPFTLATSATVQAIAAATGFSNSAVASAAYTIPVTATPTFSPAAGTIGSAQPITISDTTAGATIYYTTNGTTPTVTPSEQYAGPFTLAASATVQAMAVASGSSNSIVASAAYTVVPTATPTISPAAGTINSTQPVSISDTTAGATIYYTTNGTQPTVTPSEQYTGPFTLAATATVQAMAVASGFSNSAVASAAYTIPVTATPTFSPVAGTIGSSQPISLSDTTAGATIYYTTNGTTPTVTPSEQYTGPFTLAASATVQAMAVASGSSNSIVASAAYTVVPTATPTFSPAAGAISSTQQISISDTTAGATIYYTTNGTTPTVTPSEQYTGPFTLATSATVQAMAVAGGFNNSAVASAAYTISVTATPTFSPAAGSIGFSQPISISDTTVGATIYYTTNGTTPTVTPSEQYTGPFTLAASATVQAMAVTSGLGNSAVASAAYTVVPTATPTISPAAGTISSTQSISISDTTAGATIYYTTNGTQPVVTPSEQYTGPFTLAASATVQAMAVATGFTNSAVASAVYTIPVTATPTFNPVAGTIGSSQPVSISDTTAGAIIYYTTNGTTPTATPSEQYTGPFTLAASATVQAVAVASGSSNSIVASAAYTVVPTATPTISPAAGTISSTQPVSISDTTAGATIYYTTNGTQPTVTPSEQYTGPFTLAATATVQAMAVASGFSNSAVASAAYTIQVTATPTFSPAAGSIGSSQPISLSDTTAGATIYYTTNGTTPTVTPSEQYTGPFTLAASATVQAMAVASGSSNSAVASAAYTVVPTATPTISPAPGTINSTQQISISDTTAGATIYYTTNGTTPTVTPSEQYTGPFTLATSATVQAIAAANGFSNSAVASAAYTIQTAAATPTFSPAAGSIGFAQPISISDTTAGATIYYTTNGTTPTVTPSEQYTGPFTLAASATVQAMAVASGFSNSAVASAAYTVVPTATPTFSPGAGPVSSVQSISISDTTAGATIYYTTNGTTPTVTPSEQYTGPFTLAASATVQAMAVASGSSNSAVASAAYVVQIPPSITAQPAPQTITVGQTATFTVGVSGTAPFSYQWSKDGEPISTGTGASYTTPPATAADNITHFSVVVSNAVGNAPSFAALLTVNPSAAPAITTPPASQTVNLCQTATFTVAATGTAPFSYQWQRNSINIDGANSSSYTTPATTVGDNNSTYDVVVSNIAGSMTSSAATLTVNSVNLICVDTTSLNLGNSKLGVGATLPVTFTNGSSSVTISSINIPNPIFTVSGLSAGSILTPGQTVIMNVTFTPTATGPMTGSVTVNSTATNSPITISLSGRGVPAASHSVTISWTASTSSVVGYYVYQGTQSGGPYTRLNPSANATTSYTDTSVQAGQTYYYVVTSVNTNNTESVNSGEASVTVPSP